MYQKFCALLLFLFSFRAEIRKETILISDCPERLVDRIRNTTPDQLEDQTLDRVTLAIYF